MVEMVLYGVGFFLITILLQYLLSKKGKNKNSKIQIWTGQNTILAICVIGIVTNNIHFLAAILGFVLGDEVGAAAGWH